MADVTDHSGDQNTNSNTLKNYGVPPVVVQILAGLVGILFLAMFLVVGIVGHYTGRVDLFQRQVKAYNTNVEVKKLTDTRLLIDDLRVEIARLELQLNGETE